MAKSGTDEHQRTVAVRKCTNGPCTAAYLAIYSFRQVIRADPTPVFGRKIYVSQGFANAFLNLLGCGLAADKSFIARSLAAMDAAFS